MKASIASPTHNAAPNQLEPVLCEGGGFSTCVYAQRGGGVEFPAKQLGQRKYPHFVSFPNWFSFPFFVSKILPFLLFLGCSFPNCSLI